MRQSRQIRRDLVNRMRHILTAMIAAPDIAGFRIRPAGTSTNLIGGRAGTKQM
jgi:hypothetical protein